MDLHYCEKGVVEGMLAPEDYLQIEFDTPFGGLAIRDWRRHIILRC